MEKYIVQISSIFFVKGFIRSAVYDLGRNQYQLVPNIYCDLWNEIQHKKVSDVSGEIERNFLTFLMENEYIFLSLHLCDLERFIPLKLNFFTPNKYNSAIVCILESQNILHKIDEIFTKLETTGINSLTLYSKSEISFELISYVCEKYNDSIINSIEFILPAGNFITEQQYENIFTSNTRLNRITYYNCISDKVLYEKWPVFCTQIDLSKGAIQNVAVI